jgi:hypothetical protein
MNSPAALVLQSLIADACAGSGDPDVAAFGAALRDGRPLAEFGLDYAPWLRGFHVAAAIQRRDRAIAELGRLLIPQDGVERRLAAILADRKPLADPAQEAKRGEIVAAQKVIYSERPPPVSRNTIRRARSRYGG